MDAEATVWCLCVKVANPLTMQTTPRLTARALCMVLLFASDFQSCRRKYCSPAWTQGFILRCKSRPYPRQSLRNASHEETVGLTCALVLSVAASSSMD